MTRQDLEHIELVFEKIRPLSKQNSRDRKKGGKVTKQSFIDVKEAIQREAKQQIIKKGWRIVKDQSITIEYFISWPYPPADFENATTWFTDSLQGIAYADDALIDKCSGINLIISDDRRVTVKLTRKPLSKFSKLNAQKRGLFID